MSFLPHEDEAAASISRSDRSVRAWVLLLVDALSQAGLTPISKRRFHRIAYLSNALSSVYALPAADERIVKYRRGPFYPDLQWHLDRLAGEFFLAIKNVVHESDDYGPWMEAEYTLTGRAVEVLKVLSEIDTIRAEASFLLEITTAYARQEDKFLDDLSLGDLTYANEKHGLGAVINFQKYRDNLSARAARSFTQFAVDAGTVTLSDQINLYLEYLEEARRQAS